MATLISLLPGDVDGSVNNLVSATGLVTFSGNYSTGGDTLDLTPIMSALGAQSIKQVGLEPQGPATGFAGVGGYYVVIPGTTLANWKIKLFTAGGAELGAGAYPASVTTDVVQANILARKLI